LGALHASRDHPGSARLDRRLIIAARALVALLCALLPLAGGDDPRIDASAILGIYAAVLVALSAFEVFGKVRRAQRSDVRSS
jgi:hypothetical protein